MTRYYGHYSNASRGKRRQVSSRATVDGNLPGVGLRKSPQPPSSFSQQRRRSWAQVATQGV